MLGFGMPALGLTWVPDSQFFWASSRSPRLHGLRLRGVPRRDRVGAPSQEAAARSLGLTRRSRCGYVDRPAGRPPRDPAAAQRLHRPPEGHRARRRARRRRGVPAGADRPGGDLQLHAVPRRRRCCSSRSRSRSPGSPIGSSRATGGACRPGGSHDARPLRIEGVHKSFGKLEVLRGIDLAVAEHEVVCLIGASGSGKSTLLRCVNLLEPIDAGRIVVRGEDVTARGVDVNRVRRGIGIVFQAFNLFPHMTVLDNVTLGPRKALGQLAGRGGGERDRAARAVRPGGQARRVPGPALRRPAAARGDRPRARDAARAPAAGRGHQRARPGARRGGARRRSASSRKAA